MGEHRRRFLLIQFSKPMNFLKSLFIIFIRLLIALWGFVTEPIGNFFLSKSFFRKIIYLFIGAV